MASEITGIAPGLGRLAGVGAGVLGPALTTYTAVLLADTAGRPGTRATGSCRSCSPAARWPAAGASGC